MRAMEKRRTPFSGLLSAAAYKPLALRTIYFLCGLLVSRGAIYSEYVPFGVSLAAAAPYENALSAAFPRGERSPPALSNDDAWPGAMALAP